jgi:hypothetical protein
MIQVVKAQANGRGKKSNPALYLVLRDGKRVDSFLRKEKALQKAKELLGLVPAQLLLPRAFGDAD